MLCKVDDEDIGKGGNRVRQKQKKSGGAILMQKKFCQGRQNAPQTVHDNQSHVPNLILNLPKF